VLPGGSGSGPRWTARRTLATLSAMNASGTRLRQATEADIPSLAALWTEVFPGTRSGEERVRELREGMAYGALQDCRLLEVGGRVAAALRAYRLELHVRGRLYAVLGLAGVGVAPDFRRRGLGRKICVEALREAHSWGAVLSLLFPFRVSFYGGLGYVLAGELHHYRFRLSDLPLYPGWERVERVSEAGFGEVREVYARVAKGSNGMLERKPGAWRTLQAPGCDLYLCRGDRGVARGYVVVHRGPWKAARPTLRVREMVWEDDETYRAMLGWLSAQRDQYAHAVYDALPSEAFHRHLPHPRREGSGRPRGLWFESARILRGPMLRVVDVGGLLAAKADVELLVEDADIPENQGVWRRGERSGGESASLDGALPIAEVGRRFLEGTLPGQEPAPTGWSPIGGIEDFRLLDEF